MKTGFIGLGAMGIPMAYHLHKRGYLMAVWNRTSSKAATFASETGAMHASDLGQLCEVCQAIIICVSRDEDVKSVISKLLLSIPTPPSISPCNSNNKRWIFSMPQ